MPSADTQFVAVHGYSVSRDKAQLSTYRIWKCMRQRCNDPKHKSYAQYGGRGISYSQDWNDFACFLRDMGVRPHGMTLGRIDNSKGYFSENCRWETYAQQNRNRRSNVLITAFGRTQTLVEWSEEVGTKADTLAWRINKGGWTVEDALTRPADSRFKRA